MVKYDKQWNRLGQANLTFSVRESDMEITDSFSGVANTSAGYVSHSFNQFILVDQNANIVTLDHGDAYPRGAVLMRYNAKAGSDKFITAGGSHWNAVSEEVMLRSWSGSIGDNTTGAQLTGLTPGSGSWSVSARTTPPAPSSPAWRRPAPAIWWPSATPERVRLPSSAKM